MTGEQNRIESSQETASRASNARQRTALRNEGGRQIKHTKRYPSTRSAILAGSHKSLFSG
jgi:hypothetical protein